MRYYPPKLSLKALGLLWCHGEEKDKAYCLLQLINPPDQLYQKIAVNDENLKHAL